MPMSSMYISNDHLAATRTLANMTHTADSDRRQEVQMSRPQADTFTGLYTIERTAHHEGPSDSVELRSTHTHTSMVNR